LRPLFGALEKKIMSFNKNSLRVLENQNQFDRTSSTGISLHCHTLYSKEMLDFVPYYASKFPFASAIWRRECRRYFRNEGKMPNFNLGYWEPPLTARQVFESESENLESIGLRTIVSITDHDSIQAGLDLRSENVDRAAPISLEWTVPFRNAYFHIGVHNLPADRADEISRQLLDYTFGENGPKDDRLAEIFSLLNEIPEILVVFNHPHWDIEMIGQQEHDRALKDFLTKFTVWLHALEINGFRPWSENQAVIELADEIGLPLISGGDRHCLGSNTMINASNCASFGEFVDEVRKDKYSSIVVLPEYHQPLLYRQIRSIAQILGHYPNFAVERRHWSQRVFFDAEDGNGELPLSSHWSGRGPRWHDWAIRLFTLLGHRGMLPLFRWTAAGNDSVPTLEESFHTRPAFSRRLATDQRL
jgi:hypothetical protein